MLHYHGKRTGRIRVGRSRKSRWKAPRDKKSSLILRLRGWKGLRLFRAADAKGKFYLTRVRDMSPVDRKDYLESLQAGRRFWYTRCYMIGKGGTHRKLAIKLRFIRKPSPRPSNGVIRRKKIIRNQLTD